MAADSGSGSSVGFDPGKPGIHTTDSHPQRDITLTGNNDYGTELGLLPDQKYEFVPETQLSMEDDEDDIDIYMRSEFRVGMMVVWICSASRSE